jgi:hypothetical protein
MSTMLCSVLIPSRARAERLRKTIRSIRSTSDSARVEILVRFDDDDAGSLALIPELEGGGIRVIVGPRGQGYQDLHLFYDELARAANGAWIFIMNDDATVEQRGTPWDEQLARLPLEGFVVHPEVHQLGGSVYLNDAAGPFPIVPNYSWERLGCRFINDPTGNCAGAWFDQLVWSLGWRWHFLAGVTFNHQRDDGPAIEAHRR